MGISVGDALSRLEDRMQAPWGTHWTREEGRFALTEALRVWQALTGEILGIVQVWLPPGTTWLPAPRQLLSIRRVTLGAWDGSPLQQYTTSELDLEFGDWEAERAVQPVRWAPEGVELLAFHPAPSSVSTHLFLEGPVDIALLKEGDEVSIGHEDLTRLLGYAQNPYLTFKSSPSELSTEAMGLLVEAAAGRNSELRKTDFYRAYTGKDRVFAGKQEGRTDLGEDTVGVRQ